MRLSQLVLYPVKSLTGISVTEATVEERGFRHDRRFMLVEPKRVDGLPIGRMMTQRQYPNIALLDVAFGPGETLQINHRHQPGSVLTVPLTPAAGGGTVSVQVWDSAPFEGQLVSPEADAWFSQMLGTVCQLVYMPDTVTRPVSSGYRVPRHQSHPPAVSFADGFPYLVASAESLNELNRRLAEPVSMSRFRPNLVVSGTAGPHDEDGWGHFRVGDVSFFGVKPCVRCTMTTIDPETAQKGNEPLRTLATYRQIDHKILFGQNAVLQPGAGGVVRVGDLVSVIEHLEARL
ncbi:MOSC domain-containing protein [Rudanella lutea]|uniref:MOSC domain-containing protein n=1 Tax=Rudanella lutea TaxID=451374 RepID=UPI0003617FA7|nr:MOSC N-terminal beta barrel domain-containing protein [Rudanella lutea]